MIKNAEETRRESRGQKESVSLRGVRKSEVSREPCVRYRGVVCIEVKLCIEELRQPGGLVYLLPVYTVCNQNPCMGNIIVGCRANKTQSGMEFTKKYYHQV